MPEPDPIEELPPPGPEDVTVPDVLEDPDQGVSFDEERGEPVDLASLYDADVLATLEGWEPPEHLRNQPVPSRLASWTRTSALGAAMAGLSIALRDIYENQKARDAIVIEVDADGEPHDLPIRLMLDPDDPSGSLCIVRRDPPPPVV